MQSACCLKWAWADSCAVVMVLRPSSAYASFSSFLYWLTNCVTGWFGIQLIIIHEHAHTHTYIHSLQSVYCPSLKICNPATSKSSRDLKLKSWHHVNPSLIPPFSNALPYWCDHTEIMSSTCSLHFLTCSTILQGKTRRCGCRRARCQLSFVIKVIFSVKAK